MANLTAPAAALRVKKKEVTEVQRQGASNPNRKGETWIVALSTAKLLKRLACHIGFSRCPVQSDESKLSTKGRGTCIGEKGQVTDILSLK